MESNCKLVLNLNLMKKIALFFLLLFPFRNFAQEVAIGAWRNHLPYGSPKVVVDAGDKVYCANNLTLFSYDKSYGYTVKYSKVNGLSDIGISTIAYELKHKTLIVAYTNSNIDLIKDGAIENLTDLKRANITGDKTIYHIFLKDDLAYLSCGFGIVVLDIVKNEIKDTYYPDSTGNSIKINAVAADDDYIYASTIKGIYVASLNSNLSNFKSWHLQDVNNNLPGGNSSAVLFFKNKIYADVSDTLFVYDNSIKKWNKYFQKDNWRNIFFSVNSKHIVITQDSIGATPWNLRKVVLLDELQNVQLVNNIWMPQSGGGIEDESGVIWVPDLWYQLLKVKPGQQPETIKPNGPGSSSVTEMSIVDNEVWVASGEINSGYNIHFYNYDGFFSFIGNNWKTFNGENIPEMRDSIFDVIAVAVSPINHHVFLGSNGAGYGPTGSNNGGGGGVLEFDPGQNKATVHKYSSSLQGHPGDNNSYRITGLTVDKEGNLWVSNYGVAKPFSVMKANGIWKNFQDIPENMRDFTQVIVDENDQKWFILQGTQPYLKGIVVFNHGADIDNINDDQYILLGDSSGKGKLPTSAVKCLAEDLDGAIWVGTEAGIAVFYCPGEIFSSQGCDAQQILVEQDGFYGYLMENEIVQSIAVDGANRKWIGTSNGVWLMSVDGKKQILHFNKDNSPLFSNEIRDIAINHKTGEVFFGTDQGIISYKSDATLGDEKICDIYVYPNPVHHNYEGQIAIYNVVQNAYVKITDISGTLVYQTKALGGQAVWNGKKYNGEKPKTGVYLVFVSNEDGTETCVTKFLIVN